MQVTHVQDHVTHAVIGPNTAQSFGISESAEFFNILSNTLYSDKILAVVREVLCNAWDAHIASERTHLPIEVTLTSTELTIKEAVYLSTPTYVPVVAKTSPAPKKAASAKAQPEQKVTSEKVVKAESPKPVIKGNSRQYKALMLYDLMTGKGSKATRQNAANELLVFKKTAKVSWTDLGLPADTRQMIDKVLS